jgi:hypothetical protein
VYAGAENLLHFGVPGLFLPRVRYHQCKLPAFSLQGMVKRILAHTVKLAHLALNAVALVGARKISFGNGEEHLEIEGRRQIGLHPYKTKRKLREATVSLLKKFGDQRLIAQPLLFCEREGHDLVERVGYAIARSSIPAPWYIVISCDAFRPTPSAFCGHALCVL